MKNSKKLFLIFLSVLIVAFVSCKKDIGGSITTSTPTFKLSDIAGKWTATKTKSNTLTVDGTAGTIKAEINSTSITFTIENWDTKKNEEVQKYTTSVSKKDSSPTYDATLTIKSASSCDVSVKFGDGGSGDETFTKEATPTAK